MYLHTLSVEQSARTTLDKQPNIGIILFTMNNNNNNTEINAEEKTYFFRETITVSSKGIVAKSFDDAQEQYLDMFKDNVKFGNMIADSSDFSCHSQDKDGNEESVY